MALADRFKIKPTYRVGNAESLSIPDDEWEAVYSLGVIHHTADEFKAISEVRRVLKPGGKAYIVLYRNPSLKVGVAKVLRGIRKTFDAIFGTDRCLYALLLRRGTHSSLFGTMFHECFGGPYMKWYTRHDIKRLFARFSNLRLKNYGPNLGRLTEGRGESKFGYFWFIEATK